MADVLLALLALLCLSLFFVLRLGVKSGLAPLLSVTAVMLVFSVAGMLNVLVPVGWAFYILCGLLAAYALFYARKKPWWKQLCTPGFVLFCVMALALAFVFAVRNPVFSEWDEFSLWGTAAKLLKLNNELYSTTPIGWDWTATQSPGLFVLGYFAQFFAPGFTPWKVYWAYDVLYFACFAALLASFSFKQWRVAVPLGLVGLLTPFAFKLFHRQILLNTAYLSSYGDLPAGILFGGVLAVYFTLRHGGEGPARLWQALVPLCAFALVKDNAFPITLVAAGILAADVLFDGEKKKPRLRTRALWAGALFAGPVAFYVAWGRYAAWASALNPGTGGEVTGYSPSLAVVECLQQLFGFAPRSPRFSSTLAAFGQAYVDGENYPVSMVGSGLATTLVIVGLLALAVALCAAGAARRRALLAGLLSLGGFAGYQFMMLVSYAFLFKREGIADYARYMSSYYAGWFMLAVLLLALAAAPVAQGKKQAALSARVWGARAGTTALAACMAVVFALWAPPWLTVLEFSGEAYSRQYAAGHKADRIAAALAPGGRVYLVCQGGNGQEWFEYSYYLLPHVLDYSLRGGGSIAPEDGGVTLAGLRQYLADSGCDYILVERVDELFLEEYGRLFTDGLAAFSGETLLYARQADGQYAPLAY